MFFLLFGLIGLIGLLYFSVTLCLLRFILLLCCYWFLVLIWLVVYLVWFWVSALLEVFYSLCYYVVWVDDVIRFLIGGWLYYGFVDVFWLVVVCLFRLIWIVWCLVCLLLDLLLFDCLLFLFGCCWLCFCLFWVYFSFCCVWMCLFVCLVFELFTWSFDLLRWRVVLRCGLNFVCLLRYGCVVLDVFLFSCLFWLCFVLLLYFGFGGFGVWIIFVCNFADLFYFRFDWVLLCYLLVVVWFTWWLSLLWLFACSVKF